MDSLVTLHLIETNIEIVPSSVRKFCTNLVSFDLSKCKKLKRIEGNFHLLKSLKDLQFSRCYYDDSLVSFKFPHLPRFIRKLTLSECNLGNGDIPSDICELLNLQILYLDRNNFSRLPSSLSRIPCLKLLDFSYCKSLVELPVLPSSIAILKAFGCDSLESVGDLSDYKWLWKVLFEGCDKLIGGENERVLLSMLEGSVVEDRFMSLSLPDVGRLPPSFCTTKLVKSQLPDNWYSDFTVFLLCSDDWPINMFIKQEMAKNFQSDHNWEEFGSTFGYPFVGYVPFSLWIEQKMPWWPYISLRFDEGTNLKVGLVRMKSNIGYLYESQFDYSECWDEEYEDEETFEIESDLKSASIQIKWNYPT